MRQIDYLMALVLFALLPLPGCSKNAADAPPKRGEAAAVAEPVPEGRVEVPAEDPPTQGSPDSKPSSVTPEDVGVKQAASEVVPPGPTMVDASVGSLNVGPDAPMGTVDVRFALPAGWGAATDYGENRWGLVGADFAFGFDASCNGNCAPAAIPGNMEASFEYLQMRAEQPNYNTGDAKLDALRADVEVVAASPLAAGRIMALRVTYSEEVLKSGPYIPQLRLQCAWHRPGDSWFVTLNLRATLDSAEAQLPALLEICRTVEVLGPTPNEAQQREALKIDSERYLLSTLPAESYTVESTNSEGQPSRILLTRPVIINDLRLEPIGTVYLEYNDDPITLRDIFVAEDRAFAVGELQVTCLRRQPLRIDGEGSVRRCILAQDLVVDNFALPRFSEASFEAERVRAGQLKEDTKFPEATCRGKEEIKFDVANGGLRFCTLAEPLAAGELLLPAGTRVKWGEVGDVQKAQVPADAVMKIGDQEYPGPGKARFRDGKFEEWAQ